METTPSHTYHQLLQDFFADGQAVSYGKGQLILHADDHTHYVYFVQSGLIKIYSLNNQGEAYIHIFYGHGELFPLRWMIGEPHIRRKVFVESSNHTVLLRLPIEKVAASLQNDASLAFAFLQQLSKQFNIYADRLDNLEYKYASERLAYRLLFLAGRFGERTPQGVALPPMTQQDIAGSINLSRESANREIERLVRKGLIARDGRRLLLLGLEGLRSELHSGVHPDVGEIHI